MTVTRVTLGSCQGECSAMLTAAGSWVTLHVAGRCQAVRLLCLCRVAGMHRTLQTLVRQTASQAFAPQSRYCMFCHGAMPARKHKAADAPWRLHQRCSSSSPTSKECADLISGHGSELHVWHGCQVDRERGVHAVKNILAAHSGANQLDVVIQQACEHAGPVHGALHSQ